MESTQLTGYRRAVLRHIAETVWKGELADRIYEMLYRFLREDMPRVRCCVHKERAVMKNRIQMALWQETGFNIINASNAAMNGEIDYTLPVIDVLPDACDACPIEKYYITDICRHCVQHKCIDRCPKHAIGLYHDRASIDREECVECGICVKVCPFNAIVEVVRPCIRACEVGAISSGSDKRVVIDGEKCVTCGKCRSACPFGAIDERSMIVPLLLALKSKKKVVAMLAPSIVGQFGITVTLGQIAAALKKLGFTDIVPVAEGADLTALREAAEFIEKVPDELDFLTSSCCPAFVELIKKHYPELAENISETVSPMVATARAVKDNDKDALTCFIGPCIAKKREAVENAECVDFVLTFEELQCIFEGTATYPDDLDGETFESEASAPAWGFPLNRGVQGAVAKILGEERAKELSLDYADGLASCKRMLDDAKSGKETCDYLEGMACTGGCLDGPASLANAGMTRVLLTKMAQALKNKTSNDNKKASLAKETLDLNVKRK